MRSIGNQSLITNDLGFAGHRTPDREVGVAVPLDQTHILGVLPKRVRTVAFARDGEWWPSIEHVELRPGNHIGLNRQLADDAQRFMFGPDEAALGRYLESARTPAPPAPEPGFFGFLMGAAAVPHEFTWHRLVAALATPPSDSQLTTFEIDWKAVAGGWHPDVVLPLNLPAFPSALARVDDELRVTLYDVPGVPHAWAPAAVTLHPYDRGVNGGSQIAARNQLCQELPCR